MGNKMKHEIATAAAINRAMFIPAPRTTEAGSSKKPSATQTPSSENSEAQRIADGAADRLANFVSRR